MTKIKPPGVLFNSYIKFLSPNNGFNKERSKECRWWRESVATYLCKVISFQVGTMLLQLRSSSLSMHDTNNWNWLCCSWQCFLSFPCFTIYVVFINDHAISADEEPARTLMAGVPNRKDPCLCHVETFSLVRKSSILVDYDKLQKKPRHPLKLTEGVNRISRLIEFSFLQHFTKRRKISIPCFPNSRKEWLFLTFWCKRSLKLLPVQSRRALWFLFYVDLCQKVVEKEERRKILQLHVQSKKAGIS